MGAKFHRLVSMRLLAKYRSFAIGETLVKLRRKPGFAGLQEKYGELRVTIPESPNDHWWSGHWRCIARPSSDHEIQYLDYCYMHSDPF
jgi:hypothetical protein